MDYRNNRNCQALSVFVIFSWQQQSIFTSQPKKIDESESKSPLLRNNNKNIGSSSSFVGSILLALQENVVELIKRELIELNLQLEMLKTQKHADDIMNGLVNHMGFLLLYTMSGLTLQGSDHAGCLGA
ncbi:hypothetical protein H5410_025773 [Solanum commersonii]|uniref:Uncharacterized protein n=1 Tax=Solanum commersonii TaxID=4109 RepID=A0A9J5YUP7_SOLCO|nr:hypothetical protein H5410_025773 [Solanum commersonii]